MSSTSSSHLNNLPGIIPDTTPPVVAPPIIQNPPLQEAEGQVNDVAQKVLKNKCCCSKVGDFFTKIITWFKEIASKISRFFHDCFNNENDGDSTYSDSDYETESDNINPLLNLEDVPHLRKHKDALAVTFEDIRAEIEIVKAELHNLSPEDGKEKTESIDKKIAQIKKALTLLEKAATGGAEKNTFYILRNNYLNINYDFKSILRNNHEASKNKKLATAHIEAPKATPAAVLERQKNTPPAFKNGDVYGNNCWFHSTMELVWAMGDDFHQMIEEKEKERPQMEDEYNRAYEQYLAGPFNQYQEELEAYEVAKKAFEENFEERKIESDLYQEEFKNYRLALNAYKAKLRKVNTEFDAEMNKYNRALKVYQNDKKAWDAHQQWLDSDQSTPEPAKPENEPVAPEKPIKEFDEEAPIPPVQVDFPKQPIAPQKPPEPFNEMILLDALKRFSEGMKSGDHQSIREATRTFERAFPSSSIAPQEFHALNQQQDAAAFLESLINYLSKPLLKISTKYAGVVGTAFENRSISPKDDINILQLEFRSGKRNFQEILDENFAEEQFNDPNNAIEMGGDKVDEYTKKQTIDQPPPDFFIASIKRFAAEMKPRINRLTEARIRTKVVQLRKKDPEAYKDINFARQTAMQELKIVNYPPNVYTPKKINTPVEFPQGNIVNLGKAFGLEDSDNPDYEYELHATVIHYGSLAGGHYTANVLGKDPGNKKPLWFHTNDIGSSVKKIGAPHEVARENQAGYIFYFKKVDRLPADA